MPNNRLTKFVKLRKSSDTLTLLMDDLINCRASMVANGFTVLDNVYNPDEIGAIIETINSCDQSGAMFRKTGDLFAIRRFLNEIPEVKPLIFNDNLKLLINTLFGAEYFVVKSIYFDKPEKSNWFVAWHQDLTIAVDRRSQLHGYGPWTIKFKQFAVRPPVEILQDNFTIRVHLDDTNGGNGALRVISGSHLDNVRRMENLDLTAEQAITCTVNAGGIMIMKPLLFHASNRTTNNKKRRVVHIEFSKAALPERINWAEKIII